MWSGSSSRLARRITRPNRAAAKCGVGSLLCGHSTVSGQRGGRHGTGKFVLIGRFAGNAASSPRWYSYVTIARIVQSAAERRRTRYLRVLAPRAPTSTFCSHQPQTHLRLRPRSPARGGRLGWFGHRSRPRVDDCSPSLGRDLHETISQLTLEQLGLQHAAHVIAAGERFGLLRLFRGLGRERYSLDRRVDVVVTDRDPFPLGDGAQQQRIPQSLLGRRAHLLRSSSSV